MSTPAAIASAKAIASKNPDRRIACPVCAAELKASNLQKHLDKVHDSPADTESGEAAWRGVDRNTEMLAVAPVAIWLVCSVLLHDQIALVWFADVPMAGRIWAGVMLAGFVLGCIPVALGFARKLPATLSLRSGELELRYAFGLLRRRVHLPLTSLGTGSAQERFSTSVTIAQRADYNDTYEDRRIGSYLRFEGRDGGRAITVMATKGTNFHSHWQSEVHTASGPRRFWDIELTTVDVQQLCYLLAAHGIIAPRERQETE